jgi:hypothetical protein
MGRKSRRKLNDDDDIKDIKEKWSTKDYHQKEYESIEENNEQDKISSDLGLDKLTDILFEILQNFRKVDLRLEWVNISDIFNFRVSHGPGQLVDDRFIKELSHELYHKINKIRGIKRLNDYHDLNPTIIYNRIAYAINKWYIQMI